MEEKIGLWGATRNKYLAVFTLSLGAVLMALSPTSGAHADGLPALPTPVLGSSVAADYTFCATIINFDPANTYTFNPVGSSVATGYVWHNAGQDLACAGDVQPGDFAELDLVASRQGFTDSVVRLSGRSLADSPIHITITNYQQTADGFILEITPRTFAGEEWTLYIHAGHVRLKDTTHLEVTGLEPGQTTQGTILATLPNYYGALLDFEGTALTEGQVRQIAADAATAKAKEDLERAHAAVEAATSKYIQTVESEKAKTAAEIEAQKVAALNADLASISDIVQSPRSTSPFQIRELTTNQISLVAAPVFKSFPLETIAGLGAKQAAGLTAAQLRSLTIPQLRRLSPAVIGALKPESLGSLSVAKLKALTKAQVKQIWAAQLLQLDPAQRKAIRR